MLYLRYLVCAVLASLLIAFDWLILFLSNKLAPVGVLMIVGINVLGVGLLWMGLPEFEAERKQGPWTMIMTGLAIAVIASFYRGFLEAQ